MIRNFTERIYKARGFIGKQIVNLACGISAGMYAESLIFAVL